MSNGGGLAGSFTVLMAVYGRDDPRLLGKALRSVARNSLPCTELLVVADGPLTPELDIQLLAAEKRLPMRVHREPKNRGLAAALNAGLPLIKTDWIVRADADDVNLPHRFEALHALSVAHPEAVILGSAILELDQSGRPLRERRVPGELQEIRKFARWRSPFNHPSTAYRRDAVESVGGYPPILLREDYALWVRLLATGAVGVNTPEVLVHMSAGRDMARRRGGWTSVKSEFRLQKLLAAAGVKNRWEAVAHGAIKSLFLLSPVAVRGSIYHHLLRVHSTQPPEYPASPTEYRK